MENTNQMTVNTATEIVGVTETTEQRFNVEIFRVETGITELVIGRDLTEKQAEGRQFVGIGICECRYSVRIVEELK